MNATVPYFYLDNKNSKYIPSAGSKDESKLHSGVKELQVLIAGMKNAFLHECLILQTFIML